MCNNDGRQLDGSSTSAPAHDVSTTSSFTTTSTMSTSSSLEPRLTAAQELAAHMMDSASLFPRQLPFVTQCAMRIQAYGNLDACLASCADLILPHTTRDVWPTQYSHSESNTRETTDKVMSSLSQLTDRHVVGVVCVKPLHTTTISSTGHCVKDNERGGDAEVVWVVVSFHYQDGFRLIGEVRLDETTRRPVMRRKMTNGDSIDGNANGEAFESLLSLLLANYLAAPNDSPS